MTSARCHLRYLRYLLLHKWWVLVAGVRVGVPLWRLLIHDWSKFTPTEWRPYVRKYCSGVSFQSPAQQHAIDAAYGRAWLHHQHHNPHHWQHWVLRQDWGDIVVLEMPEVYVREMVADWMGAGRAAKGRWDAAEWYQARATTILLHWKTRVLVEVLLGLIQVEVVEAAVDEAHRMVSA